MVFSFMIYWKYIHNISASDQLKNCFTINQKKATGIYSKNLGEILSSNFGWMQ